MHEGGREWREGGREGRREWRERVEGGGGREGGRRERSIRRHRCFLVNLGGLVIRAHVHLIIFSLKTAVQLYTSVLW